MKSDLFQSEKGFYYKFLSDMYRFQAEILTGEAQNEVYRIYKLNKKVNKYKKVK